MSRIPILFETECLDQLKLQKKTSYGVSEGSNSIETEYLDEK